MHRLSNYRGRDAPHFKAAPLSSLRGSQLLNFLQAGTARTMVVEIEDEDNAEPRTYRQSTILIAQLRKAKGYKGWVVLS